MGGLFYMEQKTLRDVKPWVPDERNMPVGSLRRSDGKIYNCVSVPSLVGFAGTPWYQSGNVRPIHADGSAFDGPQDKRTDGVNNYAYGVEWAFQSYGFGIVKITGYTSGTQVTGTVTQRLPKSVTGGLPAPARTWSFTGDGVTTVYSILGAVSILQGAYSVTVGGIGVEGDPNYSPPPPSGGGFSGGVGRTTPSGGGGSGNRVP